MRHIILALMIILLPVRGWVGDVMATEMVSGQGMYLQMASHAGADQSDQTRLAHAMPDCAGHSAAAQDTPESEPDAHCATCSACQACHTVALLPEAANSVAVSPSPALPHSTATVFASAHVALGQKPPIS